MGFCFLVGRKEVDYEKTAYEGSLMREIIGIVMWKGMQ